MQVVDHLSEHFGSSQGRNSVTTLHTLQDVGRPKPLDKEQILAKLPKQVVTASGQIVSVKDEILNLMHPVRDFQVENIYI
jgi:hypothetical protein